MYNSRGVEFNTRRILHPAIFNHLIRPTQLIPAPLTMPTGNYLAKMLKEDLEEAGIEYQDDSGRFVDFHALRHTAGSLLAASGVHPKVAQSIMRHSDINLTMSRYSHVFSGQESEAVAKLPDFSMVGQQQAKATGTDGETVHTAKNTYSKTYSKSNRSRVFS